MGSGPLFVSFLQKHDFKIDIKAEKAQMLHGRIYNKDSSVAVQSANQ